MTIVDYTELVVEDEVIEGKHPLEVADQLHAYAEKALSELQNYADILEGQYIKMNIAYHRVFDWDKTEIEVR